MGLRGLIHVAIAYTCYEMSWMLLQNLPATRNLGDAGLNLRQKLVLRNSVEHVFFLEANEKSKHQPSLGVAKFSVHWWRWEFLQLKAILAINKRLSTRKESNCYVLLGVCLRRLLRKWRRELECLL